MPRHLTTVTPENVSIEYELAGFASRCAAAILDVLLQTAGLVVLGLIYAVLVATVNFSLVGWPTAVLIVGVFLLWYGYFVYFETAWNGQTPGKKALRLRVVKYGGTPIDLSCAAVRGLIRVIDMTLLGPISMLISARNQRLGDFAAGTLVVKERAQWQGDLQQAKAQPEPVVAYPEADLVRNVELLTPEQFDVTKQFVERAAELNPESKEQVASRIAVPLMEHLGIENRPGIVYSNLISALYDRCVRDRGMQ